MILSGELKKHDDGLPPGGASWELELLVDEDGELGTLHLKPSTALVSL